MFGVYPIIFYYNQKFLLYSTHSQVAFVLMYYGVGNTWIEHVKAMEMVGEGTSQSPIQFCDFRMFNSSLDKICTFIFLHFQCSPLNFDGKLYQNKYKLSWNFVSNHFSFFKVSNLVIQKNVLNQMFIKLILLDKKVKHLNITN